MVELKIPGSVIAYPSGSLMRSTRILPLLAGVLVRSVRREAQLEIQAVWLAKLSFLRAPTSWFMLLQPNTSEGHPMRRHQQTALNERHRA
jgi:hypothetical protein